MEYSYYINVDFQSNTNNREELDYIENTDNKMAKTLLSILVEYEEIQTNQQNINSKSKMGAKFDAIIVNVDQDIAKI